MKILVTGVAGFIGSHLSERLLAEGHEVVGIDALTDYYASWIKWRNLQGLLAHPRFAFVKGELTELDLASFLDGVDWVFHEAAQAGVRASWGAQFQGYLRDNLLATQRLLEAVKDRPVKKLVYASSSSVYGDAETFPTVETVTPRPVSPYGATKLAAEHLCHLYWRNYRVPVVSLRYFTVYGPRQRPDMAFHKFIRAMLTGKQITVYGDGLQTRDFTYVADIVSANLAAARIGEPGEVYNIGGGSRITLNETIHIVEGLVGETADLRHEPTQEGDARHTAADIGKAKKQLGYAPTVSVPEGLAKEVAWLRDLLLTGQAESNEAVSGVAKYEPLH